MPRYAVKASVVSEWMNLAHCDPARYTVEVSYQTNTNLLWIKMSKGGVTLPEYSTTPDLNTVDQLAVSLLREGKRRLDITRTAEEYLDMTVVLPDKPAKPISEPGPSR